MSKKFLARGWYTPEITVVEVERETEQSVWINGRKNAKVTTDSFISDTFDEAKTWMVRQFQEKFDREQRALQSATERLELAKAYKEPT